MDQTSFHATMYGALLWLTGMALILGAAALLAYEDWCWLEDGRWPGIQLQDALGRTPGKSSWEIFGMFGQWLAELPASAAGLVVGVALIRLGGDIADEC